MKDIDDYMEANPKKMKDGRDLKAYIFGDAQQLIEARFPFSRFGVKSTQGTEAMNAAPGCIAVFHRYRHPVFAVVGFVI